MYGGGKEIFMKKLLSLVLAVCILLQISGTVIFANDGEKFQQYFINDDFNTAGDLGNWEYVYGNQTGKNITFKQTTMTDGTGVMEFGADRWSSQSGEASPTISNDFEDIDLDSHKIVIETRYRSNGGGTNKNGNVGALNWLKFNQPEDVALATDRTVNNNTISYFGSKAGVLVSYGSSGVGYKSNAYSTTVSDSTLTAGQWVNAKIVIDNTDGTKNDYTLTTWKDGAEAQATTATGTFVENGNYYYNPELFMDGDITNDQTRHKSLQNLLFSICQYSDTMYIDYVRGYFYRDYLPMTASLVGDATIRPADSVKVKLTASTPLTSFTDGLITIDGVETSVTFDVATQTATITPAENLVAGESYTVRIDTDLLGTSGGFNLEGTNTLDFSVTRVNAYNLEITGEPVVDGILGVDYDYSSVNDEGSHLFQWETSVNGGVDWIAIGGETSSTLSLGERFTHGQMLRVKMTPVDINGEQGSQLTSNVVIFQLIPLVEGDGANFRKYYINEDYEADGDAGNWKIANTSPVAGQTVTLNHETLTENGSSVGVIKFYSNKANQTDDQQPSVINDFKDIQFNENSKIVVETRVKAIGGYDRNGAFEGSDVSLTFNRPNDPKYLPANISDLNFAGYHGGALFIHSHESGLKYKNTSSGSTSFVSGDFRNTWVNVKIVIDGTDGSFTDYTITAWDDENTYNNTSTGTLNEYKNAMYDVPSYVDRGETPKTAHTDFRSLSFVLRNYGDTVYVDYLKVYELRPTQTATISLPDGTTISPADSVTVKFNASTPIDEFADNLVTIDGVECDITSDVAQQTVTLKPKQKLTPGETYTLKVSSAILGASEGYILGGTTEFVLNVATINIYDVVTTGRTVPGTVMGVSFTYKDSFEDEGEHLYRWQKSTDGVSWTDITGQTASTYTVTQDIYDNENYVRVAVTPVGANGTHGLETFAAYVIPEAVPVLENVHTNTTLLFPDMYLTPVYSYFDANGDKITNRTVNWYSSNSASGPWELVSTDENYYIIDSDMGKYFKFDIKITNNATLKNETTVYESGVVGPVVDILESTNMLVNSGFERGDITGWSNNAGIIELAGEEGARTGNFAVHLKPRASVHDNWAQTVNNLVVGKSYILGGYVRTTSPDIPTVTRFLPYHWSGLSTIGSNNEYLIGNEWIHTVGAKKATATTGSVDFVSFYSMEADCYIDDTYFGELVISDIETFTPEATEIPTEGTVKLSVTSGKILNQLGTTHGLTDEKVNVRVPDGVSGITQDGNNIVIDNNAIAGTYEVEIYCEPSYTLPAQSIFQKFITLELLANNDKTPKARNVKATGNVKTGSTLKGTYDYYQVDGVAEGTPVIKWMYSDSYSGNYLAIPGATESTYVVTDDYADKFIKFAVIPVTSEGAEGTITYSNVLTNPRAPFATDVTVSGDFKVGGTVKATYTHKDYNEDDEADTPLYKWYVSSYSDSGFAPIAGATSESYVLTENEIDKYIKVSVTPVSKVAPTTGEAVLSTSYFGPTAPIATNVTITQNGPTLMGTYKYYHKGGATETNSTYKWTVDGKVVSTKIDYIINFSGTKYVQFTVTPVGDTNPSTGNPVSFGAYIAGNPSGGSGEGLGGTTIGGGGGGAGGGGGGGATGSIGVTPIPNTPPLETEVKQPEQTQPKSDLSGHWGEVYVKEMEERGVMKADEKGNYDPDRIVSRSEMISYLFDALGLEEAEYSAEFSDVSALDDYAGKLQAMINNGTIANYHEFRPTDGISRQEMCKILYVSLQNAGKLTKAETNVLDAFTDKALISDWAIDYVNTIYSNKIMIGTSDTTFAPTENITRAQVATMLVRILKVIEG